MSNYKPWATLEKDGVHKRFATEQEARERAQQAVVETGTWVGIQQHDSRGWWLIDTVDPEETATS